MVVLELPYWVVAVLIALVTIELSRVILMFCIEYFPDPPKEEEDEDHNPL